MSFTSYLSVYGSDQQYIKALIKENPSLGTLLSDNLPYTEAEVTWAVRNEMARTVEDVLARRLRLLFLDAKAAMSIAPKVASIMATELGYDDHWEKEQVNIFTVLANRYLLESPIGKIDSLPNSLAIA
jgi:glycerol-3-phosphate dehydrogenase